MSTDLRSASPDGPASATTFPWGVASGDPTDSSITLWTRLHPDAPTAGGRTRMRWDVWTVDGTEPAGSWHGDAPVGTDGVVRHRVDALPSGRRFDYRFSLGAIESPTGRTSTIDRAAPTVRLGVACCARLASGSFEPYDGLRRSEPDLVVHLGDYIYEDGERRFDRPEGTPHRPAHPCRTVEDYDERYGQYRRNPHLRGLHREVPWVLTLDDHEVTDDAVPPPDAVSDRRVAAAITARNRWMPQAAHGNGPTAHDRLVELGDVGDLVLVDTRLAGREDQQGSGPTLRRRRRPRRRLLDDRQWTWLEEQIATPRSGWLLIASQVQVAPLRLGWLPRLRPLGVRPVVNPDQWDGYPAERERLVRMLDRHGVDKVLLLSGDLHAGFVTSIGRDGVGRDGPQVFEVTTPAVSAPSFAELVQRRLQLPPSWPTWRLVDRWLRRINPHIVEMDLATHGTTVLDVSVDAIDVRRLDVDGRVARRWLLTADTDRHLRLRRCLAPA